MAAFCWIFFFPFSPHFLLQCLHLSASLCFCLSVSLFVSLCLSMSLYVSVSVCVSVFSERDQWRHSQLIAIVIRLEMLNLYGPTSSLTSASLSRLTFTICSVGANFVSLGFSYPDWPHLPVAALRYYCFWFDWNASAIYPSLLTEWWMEFFRVCFWLLFKDAADERCVEWLWSSLKAHSDYLQPFRILSWSFLLFFFFSFFFEGIWRFFRISIDSLAYSKYLVFEQDSHWSSFENLLKILWNSTGNVSSPVMRSSEDPSQVDGILMGWLSRWILYAD